jgi:hypothetical protein
MAAVVTQQVFTTTRSGAWRELTCAAGLRPASASAEATACESYWFTLQPSVVMVKTGMGNAEVGDGQTKAGLAANYCCRRFCDLILYKLARL